MENNDRKQTAEDRKHIASVAQWLEQRTFLDLLAQMAEQLPFKEKVAGSIPVGIIM